MTNSSLNSITSLPSRLKQSWLRYRNDRRIESLSQFIKTNVSPAVNDKPVIFFNASTRLGGVSQNAAYAFLASCGLQLAGVPVLHFACKSGMSRCPLGVKLDKFNHAPPCRTCISQSKVLTSNAEVSWFSYRENPELVKNLQDLSLEQLYSFEYQGVPLGRLTLPSLRWVLRLHHLPDEPDILFLFREFISSAFNIAQEFSKILEDVCTLAVVVFNGITFPEATVKWVAKRKGVRVISHEVAHRPLSAFFSDGEATAYPVNIPESFELNHMQNARLDSYLEQRFQGNFSMAGIKFWPEMEALDNSLLERIQRFDAIVPVFTNVIFDTSQIHANVIFSNMFAWLDQIQAIALSHPNILFIIRAHPDELRPASRKQSRETVSEWVYKNQVNQLPNVVFIDSIEYISSYALIERSKFVMVYNSTIGLEAVLMGKAVLNGGKARYTQLPVVFLPETPDDHRKMAHEFLSQEHVEVPPEFIRNARRFLYFQLYRTPLPFEDFIQPQSIRGYVHLKEFDPNKLHPDKSPTMRVIVNGITQGDDFILHE